MIFLGGYSPARIPAEKNHSHYIRNEEEESEG
jgi:hypothetical protein